MVEQSQPRRRWQVIGAVYGVLLGLFITAIDNISAALGLPPDMRTGYQLAGAIGGGYLGAAVGRRIDRRRAAGSP